MRGDVEAVLKLERYCITPDVRLLSAALDAAVCREDRRTAVYILGVHPHASLTEALSEAVRANSPDMVRLLLENGADPSCVDNSGISVLFDAVSGLKCTPSNARAARSKAIVGLLRRGGAHLNIYQAIVCGDVSDLELQLEMGVDANACLDNSQTPLATAYAHLHEPAVGGDGTQSPTNSRLQSISLLRAFGAHCSLHEAVLLGLVDELKWQLDGGADPNACTVGQTPVLYEAAANENVEIVRLLLDYGAIIDAPTPYGKTALMAARAKGNIAMERFLLARGANPHLVSMHPN
jgi:ankyrin repeat protein